MLEKTTQPRCPKSLDRKVDEKLGLPTISLDNLNIVEMADHLNVPISKTDRQLNTKPFFLYPNDGLYGLL